MPTIQETQDALWTSPTPRIKTWHTVHIDLIGLYTVTAKQQQLAERIINM
jgi:hypothetical protein